MTIFDVIKDLFEKKGLIEENKELIENDRNISIYILNMFVSQSPSLLPLVNEIQAYSGCLSKIEYLKLLQLILPNNYKYYKYIKKEKEFECKKCGFVFQFLEEKRRKAKCPSCGELKPKEIPVTEIVKYLAKYFNVATKDAIDYRKLLSEKQTISILRKFGETTKPILKKLGAKEKSEKTGLHRF